MKSKSNIISKESTGRQILGWFFGILFLTIGILNFILVHPVPGAFYTIFSFIYFPPITVFFREKTGFIIPFFIKVIVGLIILWGTLAVTDLPDILGL